MKARALKLDKLCKEVDEKWKYSHPDKVLSSPAPLAPRPPLLPPTPPPLTTSPPPLLVPTATHVRRPLLRSEVEQWKKFRDTQFPKSDDVSKFGPALEGKSPLSELFTLPQGVQIAQRYARFP